MLHDLAMHCIFFLVVADTYIPVLAVGVRGYNWLLCRVVHYCIGSNRTKVYDVVFVIHNSVVSTVELD